MKTCSFPALFAQWVDPLVDCATVSPGQRVLDVACGTGVVAPAAARVVGPHGYVSGIDLNPAMIEVAQEVDPTIDWRVGDATDLPYEDGSFDVALCQSAPVLLSPIPWQLSVRWRGWSQ